MPKRNVEMKHLGIFLFKDLKNCSFLLSFVLAFFFFSPLSAQCDLSLSGRIYDLHDDTAIEGALITIESLGISTQTVADGSYLLEGLCVGKINLLITHPLCEAVRKSISLRYDLESDFALEHHAEALEEVILSEKKIKRLSQTVRDNSLDQALIERSSSEDLASTLTQISGISALQTGVGIAKPVIHGMYGSRVSIVKNGFSLEDHEWGADHAPNIDPNNFDNIQLVKGGAVLKYGGDTPGGIVVLKPSKIPLRDSLYGKSLLTTASNGRGGTFHTSAIRSSQNGFFFNLGATLKYYGDFQAPDYVLTNTGIRQQSLFARIGRNRITKGWEMGYSSFNTSIGILSASHIGNIQDLYRAIKSPVPLIMEPFSYELPPPRQESNHHTAFFKTFRHLENGLQWNLHYEFQQSNRFEYDIRRDSDLVKPSIDLRLNTHNLLSDVTWETNTLWRFNTGISVQLQENYPNPATGVRRLIPDYVKYEAGSFFTADYSPNNQLFINLGIRLDYVRIDAEKYYYFADWQNRGYAALFPNWEVLRVNNQILTNPVYNYWNTSIAAGLLFKTLSGFHLSLNYLRSQRTPNPSELFSDGLHHSLASIEYGDLLIQKETTDKILLEISKETGAFTFSFSPYISTVDNFIFNEPSDLELTTRGAFPVWNYKALPALFYGTDVAFSYAFSPSVQFKADASYLKGNTRKPEKPLINMPPLNTAQNLKVFFGKRKQWQWQLNSTYVFEQKYFPDNNFPVSLIENGVLIERVVDVSTPPKAFHLMDTEITLFVKKQPSNQFIIRGIVNNLLDTSYRNYLDRLRYFADAMGRNFQLQFIVKY